jgi:hypothetical protein
VKEEWPRARKEREEEEERGGRGSKKRVEAASRSAAVFVAVVDRTKIAIFLKLPLRIYLSLFESNWNAQA